MRCRRRLVSARGALCIVLLAAGCRGEPWADSELEAIPRPARESMERRVRERTEELEEALDASRTGADAEKLAEAYGELGRHYHAHELHDAAAAAYRNATRLQPGRLLWRYLEGVVGQATGDLEVARAAFEEVRRAQPDDPVVAVRLAEVLLALGDAAAAEAVVAPAAAALPAVPLARYFYGKSLAAQGRHPEAIAAFEAALAAQPEANAVHYALALSARASGDEARAVDHLARRGDTEVTIDDPVIGELQRLNVGAVAHLRRGARAQIEGDWVAARRHYRRAVDADPSNPEARQSLAAALLRAGEREAAIEHYRAALPGDPSATLRTNLASLLADRGEHAEALRLLDEALAEDPSAVRPQQLRAATLAVAGRLEESVDAYRSLIERASDPTPLRLALAETYAAAGDRAAAERELAMVLAGQPVAELEAGARGQLAGLAAAAGDDAAALRELDRAIALAPDLAPAHFARANLLGKAQRYREAAAGYGRVVAMLPEHLPARLGEITALTLAGELERAAVRVEEGLRRLPGHPDLERARRELAARREASL